MHSSTKPDSKTEDANTMIDLVLKVLPHSSIMSNTPIQQLLEQAFRIFCGRNAAVDASNLLLSSTIDVAAQGSPSGKTALHQAVKAGSVESVILILFLANQRKPLRFLKIKDANGKVPSDYLNEIADEGKRKAIACCIERIIRVFLGSKVESDPELHQILNAVKTEASAEGLERYNIPTQDQIAVNCFMVELGHFIDNENAPLAESDMQGLAFPLIRNVSAKKLENYFLEKLSNIKGFADSKVDREKLGNALIAKFFCSIELLLRFHEKCAELLHFLMHEKQNYNDEGYENLSCLAGVDRALAEDLFKTVTAYDEIFFKLIQQSLSVKMMSEGLTVTYVMCWHFITDLKAHSDKIDAAWQERLEVCTHPFKTQGQIAFQECQRRINEIFKLRESLRTNKSLGLYVYRLHQFMTNKNRPIPILLLKQEDNAVGKGAYEAASQGHKSIKDAINDYHKLLTSTLVEFSLNRLKAEDVVNQLHKIIFNGQKSELVASNKVSSEYFDIMMRGIISKAQQLLDYEAPVGNLKEFATLVVLESAIQRRVENANIILAAMAEESREGKLGRPAEEVFKERFEASETQEKSAAPLSHAEILGKDKKVLKNLEQNNREMRREMEASKAKLSFAMEMKEANEKSYMEKQRIMQDDFFKGFKQLSATQKKFIQDFMDSTYDAGEFKESDLVSVFGCLKILSTTAKGYKIQIGDESASSHRSHGLLVDPAFVTSVRTILSRTGIDLKWLHAQVKGSMGSTAESARQNLQS